MSRLWKNNTAALSVVYRITAARLAVVLRYTAARRKYGSTVAPCSSILQLQKNTVVFTVYQILQLEYYRSSGLRDSDYCTGIVDNRRLDRVRESNIMCSPFSFIMSICLIIFPSCLKHSGMPTTGPGKLCLRLDHYFPFLS